MRKGPSNGHPRTRNDSAPSRRRTNGHTDAADRRVNMKPLQGYLGYALRRAQMLAYADFIAALGELNLSPGQFGVLTVIETNPGLKQSEVSAALGIQKTNFVAVLNEFERRGLAERRPAAADGRSYALYLTAAGQSLLRRARAAQARHEAHLVRRIGPQGREQLLALLNRLTAGE
ncbi:MAG TPA: MarR family winged helix-turn-helix transcriptional regulator [Steroidobacteraceae bacterium]